MLSKSKAPAGEEPSTPETWFTLEVKTTSSPRLSALAFWFLPLVVLVTSLGVGAKVTPTTMPMVPRTAAVPATSTTPTGDLDPLIVAYLAPIRSSPQSKTRPIAGGRTVEHRADLEQGKKALREQGTQR